MEENLNTLESMQNENVRADMNFEYAERLKEEYQKALSSCIQKTEQWEKLRKDYEILRSRLETLPERISHDIMVPFGSLAFMPGQLIHTNEILTLLGANWFAAVSSRHAVEISNRRIAQCEKMLKDLADEKKQCENCMSYMDSAINSNLVEIVEYDDENYVQKSQRRRVQHSKSQSGKTSMNVKDSQDVAKEVAEVSDNLNLINLGNQETSDKVMENVPFENDLDESDDLESSSSSSSSSDDDDEEEEKDDSSEEHLKSDGKHVKWKDQEGEKMKNRITFTHSSQKSKSHPNIKPMAISKAKSKSKDSAPLSPVNIQSPVDIYKCFSTKPEQSKPKSILKRTSSIDENDGLPASLKHVENEQILKTRFKEQTAFTGKIVEHELDRDNFNDKIHGAERPPSRFKAQRQSKQR